MMRLGVVDLPALFLHLLILAIVSAAKHLKKSGGVRLHQHFLAAGHIRSDPIITQTCLPDHVHTFYGPSQMLHPAVTSQELRDSSPAQTTGGIKENKSLYWHPTIYRHDRHTEKYDRQEIDFGSAYYLGKVE